MEVGLDLGRRGESACSCSVDEAIIFQFLWFIRTDHQLSTIHLKGLASVVSIQKISMCYIIMRMESVSLLWLRRSQKGRTY